MRNQYKVKLNTGHTAQEDQIKNGYLAYCGAIQCYGIIEARKEAELFGGTIEPDIKTQQVEEASRKEERKTDTLRDKVRNVIEEYIEKELAADISDIVFNALGITEDERDIKGAKVCVNPKVIITINGGLAEVCEYHPLDIDMSIRDYDIQGECESPEELESLPENEYGGKYIERFVKF